MVTGGAGFLGSHFVKAALARGASKVLNVDVLNYAGDHRRLNGLADDTRYRFIRADVAAPDAMKAIVSEHRPDVIVHYAAETHVTRSENAAERFFRTNLEGTRSLLDAAVAAGTGRFIHVSTDEIYGPILEGAFKESDKPSGVGSSTSPYAQSKALADDLAVSYSDRIETVVARPTNAFGPWQYPEKAFPRWITRALRGEQLLVWGDGLYVRQWLFAEDFAAAIALLADRGEPGAAYNVGPVHDPEITNLGLAQWLAAYLDLRDDRIKLTDYDRPDHDRRYAVDPAEIRALGWRPGSVHRQLEATVDWYRDNEWWWRSHIDEAESIYSDA
ncbi:MAG: dTDP-glucose 4,6-dehydratase [Actinomycetota bacterium]